MSGDAILDVNKINNGDLQNSIYISADKSKGVVNTVQKESDGLYITILDDTFLLNCDNVIILDKVKIPYENVISGSVRVSGDLIIYNRIDDKGDVFLESYDFKNETLKHSFNVSDIMAGDVTDHDIRSEDGMVIFIQGYSADLFYLYIIDGDYTSKDLPAPILINRYESAKFKGFKVFFSEHDSNVFYIVDDDVVTARYISQPHEPAKILDGFSLNLPPKISFLNACFPFSCGGPLEYKFDTNNTPGNDINISNITHINNNSSVFLMMHNQGRIYFKEIFPEADYLDLVSLYDETIDQGYSGLGLTVNNYLQKIVNDTLNLYTHTSKIPKGTLIKNIPVLTRVVRGVSPDINLRDFFTHSNESTNYVVLDRVLSKLYKLQKDYYELMCDVDRVVPDPNYGKLPERERPTYPLPTPELTAPKPTPTPTPLPVPTCPDRFTKPRYQIITTLVPGISSEETLLVEELVPVPPTVPPLPTPYKGPITIAPSPTPTPRPYVPPKVAPRIWISICDESSRASATTIQSQWNQFRKYEPQSKFLLIQPDGETIRLKIPVNWGSDANTGLFRGRTGGANRWFNWAKLGSYPQQTRVHIWFDTSGSNRTDRSSRDQLIDLCKQKGLIVSSNEDSNENWVAEPLRDALGYKTTGASAININNNITTAPKTASSSLFGGITLLPPPVITYNVKPTTQTFVRYGLATALAAAAALKKGNP